MNHRVLTLLAVAMLALPLPCISQELSRLNVTMKAFEASGDVDTEYAESLSHQLMVAIEQSSEFRITPGGPTRFYLKGLVRADKKRHLITLQLFETQTNRVLWLESYDYRRVNADKMAADVISELYSALSDDRWQ